MTEILVFIAGIIFTILIEIAIVCYIGGELNKKL